MVELICYTFEAAFFIEILSLSKPNLFKYLHNSTRSFGNLLDYFYVGIYCDWTTS